MEGEAEENETEFTLEPSKPVVLDVEELRLIAQAARDKASGTGSKTPISKENLEMHIASMERDIKNFAAEGAFEVSWNFFDVKVPLHQVHEVSREFKKRHSGLYIEVHGGAGKIFVSWKPKKRY